MSYATAFVKGGMPVSVRGALVKSDRTVGCPGGFEDIKVFWHNTGRPVTRKFEASLSKQDWDDIHAALIDSHL